uniref:Superoxide dismutase Cu-Zn n=1 Tax=Rhizophora mucronata TaxID=61149 RepID=A0A2P2LVC1_RHIMU
MIPHATLPPAFPVLLLSSCPPVYWKKKLSNQSF